MTGLMGTVALMMSATAILTFVPATLLMTLMSLMSLIALIALTLIMSLVLIMAPFLTLTPVTIVTLAVLAVAIVPLRASHGFTPAVIVMLVVLGQRCGRYGHAQ